MKNLKKIYNTFPLNTYRGQELENLKTLCDIAYYEGQKSILDEIKVDKEKLLKGFAYKDNK